MVKPEGIGALVLAAGKGTRMKSPIPKVLHTILEEPLLRYPLSALSDAGIGKIAVVVGHGAEEVGQYLRSAWPGTIPLRQVEQKGTGHAVQISRDWWEHVETLVVLPGDAPLLTQAAIESLLEKHAEKGSAATLLTFELENPHGYGRVVRNGDLCRIVEEKDATVEERTIKEVNSGIYAFRTDALKNFIDLLENRNAQGEFYLPDVLPLFARSNLSVETLCWGNPEDLSGINDPYQLAIAGRRMRDRILLRHLHEGVKIMDLETSWIGPDVVLEPDVRIEADVQIWGTSTVRSGAVVGSHSILRNSTIGNSARLVAFCCVTESEIGAGAKVGPFACIRDNTCLAPGALVGKFVEAKNSFIGEGSKVPHLSYMGDATIGRETNIGAGTITCNYDGSRKNPTHIGDHCFIGSDTMLVAPVTLHEECFTAAGSTITEDVPAGALAVGRARQRNIEGWARRKNAVPRKEED
ncbi:MAG: bifunctional UDP-N-acetylglucosamine diphosphorylase/glucosamine-1-phosphate N-acetyltransferase GlmU [Synergistales bacterium]